MLLSYTKFQKFNGQRYKCLTYKKLCDTALTLNSNLPRAEAMPNGPDPMFFSGVCSVALKNDLVSKFSAIRFSAKQKGHF